jgi:hypothetical protein
LTSEGGQRPAEKSPPIRCRRRGIARQRSRSKFGEMGVSAVPNIIADGRSMVVGA